MSQSKGTEKKNDGEQSQESEHDDLDETIVESGTQKSQRQKRNEKNKEKSGEKETTRYTHEEIDTMKLVELREAAKKLKLSATGNKLTLRNRLKDAMKEEDDNETDEEEEEDDQETDEEDEKENDEEDEESESDSGKKSKRKSRFKKRKNDSSEEESEREKDEKLRRRGPIDMITRQVSSVTIKDGEDSLSYFTGDDKLPINHWIQNFENTSALLGWNELQKFIYGKRMLRGSARQFITFERGVMSWDSLKNRLIEEFKTEVNPATIHSQLYKRRQQPNESSRKYIYSMQEIASQGRIEEAALLQYIADGLQGERRDKAVLYGSRTLSELKKNIQLFDKIKEGTGQKTRIKKDESRNNTASRAIASPTTKKAHCYGCGSAEHEYRVCPNKDKGLKCFKCNDFGHIASNCNKAKQSEGSISKINSIHISSDKVALKINGVSMYALLDTGSEVSVMNSDVYNDIGKPMLCETTRQFTGLGNAITRPVGVFEAKIVIGNDMYTTNMFVLNRADMRDKVILGRDLLKHLDVRINKGRVEIKKANAERSNATENEKIKECEDSERRPNGSSIDTNTRYTDNRDSTKECEDISYMMKINYIENDAIDVKQPYKMRIEQLIQNYKPSTNTDARTETKITLTDDVPVCSKPRRLAPKEKKIVTQQLDEWLRDGIIQTSTSEYSSPVVVVSKKDGSYRVCIDYRKLNEKIVRDQFPMPLIEDCLDALTKAKVFSVIDLKNGFFHVKIAEDSRKFTSFVTPDGQFEFLRIPFGLCTSPTSFLRFIDEVFRDLIRKKIVLTYMDDLIIPGIDNEDAYQKLEETLKVAAERGLTINWKKCKFLQENIEFLGHIIHDGNIRPSPTKVKAVQQFPEPKTKKQLQSFLGLAGYFRKFIKNYAKIALPLSDMLKSNKAFIFNTPERKSFLTLKHLLSEEPVLRIYDPEAITELHTDASIEGYGAVLLQRYGNEKYCHPVYYMSCKTSEAEKKCHSYELEILAVIKAVRKFRVYLLGIKFKLITDCQAFQKTLKKKDLSPKIARWALTLEEFDFECEHRSGEKLKHADALSRSPIMCIEDTLLQTIRKKQEEEERLRVIRHILEKEPYEDYVMESNILMKNVNGKNVIVLPTSLQANIIKKIHENGHFSSRKVAERVKEEFYIPNLNEKIEKIISCCIPCILAERKSGKKEGQLQPIPKGDSPLETYHIDHLGPMTATNKAYKHILVVVDGFSKFVWLYPTKSTTTKEVLDKLTIQQKTFGNPTRIISDRGTAFTSTDFKNYCATEGIEHILITTGVPRGNGQVERINRIIISVLTKLSLDKPERWYQHVDRVQKAINSTYQRSIDTTPFEIMFGLKMKQREDVTLLSLIQKEALEQFSVDRLELRNVTKENLLKIQEENRRSYNRKCKDAVSYQEGDIVAIKRTQFGTGLKLHKKFLGPYKVSKCKGKNRYEVIRVGEGEGPKITTTAADFMKLFREFSSGSEEIAGMAECRE